MGSDPVEVDRSQHVVERRVAPADSLVLAAVSCVADAADESVEQLPPLDDAVDCDALERLFDGSRQSGRVVVPYYGYVVVVTGDRTVRVHRSQT